MHRKYANLSAALAVLGLITASCGDDNNDAATAATPAATAAAPGTDAPADTGPPAGTTAPAETDVSVTTASTTEHTSGEMDHSSEPTDDAGDPAVGPQSGAAALRAGLTSLLQEHVYLAGAALATAVQAGGDMEAPAVTAAVQTLDANSVALSQAIGTVYGDDAAAQFLEQWRAHIGFFVDYTLGGATGDTAGQETARTSLDDYRADFAAFIESATGGELAATDTAAALQVHVDSLIVAIDAILAGTPDVYTKLAQAASHMPMTAQALADAIATQMPEGFEGDVNGPGSELRSGLTHLLQEHVYLAGLGINQAVTDGGDLAAPATADAVGALDVNSVALSEAIGSVYGDDAAVQFLAQWRAHIGFFVDYTLGGATGDTAGQEQARTRLDDYRADFAAFIESATGGELAAADTAAALQVHVDSLIVAIDAVIAGAPEAVLPALREAALHMPGTALTLSSAIAAQMPDSFGV